MDVPMSVSLAPENIFEHVYLSTFLPRVQNGPLSKCGKPSASFINVQSSRRIGKVDLLKDERGDEMDNPFSFGAFQTTSFRSIPFVWTPVRTGKVCPSKTGEKQGVAGNCHKAVVSKVHHRGKRARRSRDPRSRH